MCADGGACKSKDNAGREKLPVEVTLEEARAYTNWLSAKTGQTYRLISEAEWERIMRAGTTTAYWWGSTMEARPEGLANNQWDITAAAWNGSRIAGTTARAEFRPTDAARTTGDCTRRVVRGSGDNQASTLRSAHRSPATLDATRVGFRVVGSLLDR